MNLTERKKFWDVLSNLDGKDGNKDSQLLSAVIKYPPFLYRYREVSTKNLEALRTNRLFFSTSNYYDDPFDTFLHIDNKKLNNEINQILSSEKFPEAVYYYFMNVGIGFTEAQVQELLNRMSASEGLDFVSNFIKKDVRNFIKMDTYSICFSENGCNESLWLKYADEHKGFCLKYDLLTSFKCFSLFSTCIYPVYYSEKKYDATEFAKWYSSAYALRLMLPKEKAQAQIEKFPPMKWERERITLIKKICHKFDKEWRMMTFTSNLNSPNYIEWKPQAIILGLNMPETERQLVSSLAKDAGIKNILESYIDERDNLNTREIQIKGR